MNCKSVYGNYRTRKFSDIFSNAESFKSECLESGIPSTITEKSLITLFYLLYARYGNSNIASIDENQFKYKVFSTIFMYGPAWEKRLEIQEKLRNLSDDEIRIGSTAIHNTALNPSSIPTVQTLEELEFINSQNTSKYRKSKLEALASLYTLIATDVTEEFVGKFKKLFIIIVEPNYPLYYVTEGEEDD